MAKWILENDNWIRPEEEPKVFKEDKWYLDCDGRKWLVKKIRHIGPTTENMIVGLPISDQEMKYEIAIVDGDTGTASVLLDDGFTTIYADTEEHNSIVNPDDGSLENYLRRFREEEEKE
jgi:hypothetical protein